MPLIRVLDRAGKEHEIQAPVGTTLMEALRDLEHGVPALCGGMCSCATCHVYVHPEWIDKLLPAMSDEMDVIAELAHASGHSRLSCQIQCTEELSQLQVTIAPEE